MCFLLFTITCLFFGVSSYQLFFFFSIVLIGIINFNDYLRNIVLAISYKKTQLLMVFLLISLIVLIYANIGMRYFYDDFLHEEYNYCESLFSCFSYVYLYGFRVRGGVAIIMKQLSYNLEFDQFAGRTIYDFSHFFLNAVIMLNIVLAIIIDSYKELREKSNKYYNEMMNNCLICGASREEMEQVGNNFEHHIKNIHVIDDYINCMIYLRIQNLQDLNSIQAAIKQKLDKNDTSWFPTYDNNSKNLDEEKNLPDLSKLINDIQENNDALLKGNIN